MAPAKYCAGSAATITSKKLIINKTREIHQASSNSTTMSTNAKSWANAYNHGTKSFEQKTWDTVKAVLMFRRPPCFPSSSVQRAFRAHVRKTANGKLDALKSIPAPSTVELEIPDGLLFENMLDGETSSPLRLSDFKEYLSAEGTLQDLQLLLWYKDYTRRFALLAPEEMILHPPWTDEDHERAIHALSPRITACPSKVDIKDQSPSEFSNKRWPSLPSFASSERKTSSEDQTRPSTSNSEDEKDGFRLVMLQDQPRRPSKVRLAWAPPIQMAEKPLDIKLVAPWDEPPASYVTCPYFSSKCNSRYREQIAANQRLPITIDSLRADVNTTLEKHINAPSSISDLTKLDFPPSALHLTGYAAARSLHPSSFYPAISHIESTLRNESYPRFLLSAHTTANSARVRSGYCLGLLLLLTGIAANVLCVLNEGQWSRGWRVLASIISGVGAIMVFSAWNGTCAILEGRGRMQRKPWVMGPDAEMDFESASVSSQNSAQSTRKVSRDESTLAWVKKYQRRWFISRIFDHTNEVQEAHIRRGQRVIFWQSMWAGFLVFGVLMVMFLPI